MTQRERVAHILRVNGHAGVHTFELRQAYIGNPSERIADLEREGWEISHTRERLHGTATGTRYRKVSEPDVGGDTGPARVAPHVSVGQAAGVSSSTQETLFTPPSEPHYRDAA